MLDLLSDRAQSQEVMSSIKEINREFFGNGDDIEVRPPEGFGSCPAFDSSSDVSIQLRATYEATMPALYFGSDPLPDWVAICRRVAERRDLSDPSDRLPGEGGTSAPLCDKASFPSRWGTPAGGPDSLDM